MSCRLLWDFFSLCRLGDWSWHRSLELETLMEPEMASRLPLEARLLNDDGGCCGIILLSLISAAVGAGLALAWIINLRH